MDLRLSRSSQNTRGLERDSDAKLTTTPHRCGAVMVRHAREREIIGSWDELTRQFTSNFNLTYK
jgi:hypothetical protein